MSHSSAHTSPKARLTVETLEDRTTPTFLAQPQSLLGPFGLGSFNGVSQPFGGLSIAAGDLYPDPGPNLIGLAENEYVLGTGPGVNSLVTIYGRTGNLRNAFSPFPGFKGGINVA